MISLFQPPPLMLIFPLKKLRCWRLITSLLNWQLAARPFSVLCLPGVKDSHQPSPLGLLSCQHRLLWTFLRYLEKAARWPWLSWVEDPHTQGLSVNGNATRCLQLLVGVCSPSSPLMKAEDYNSCQVLRLLEVQAWNNKLYSWMPRAVRVWLLKPEAIGLKLKQLVSSSRLCRLWVFQFRL